MWTPKRIVLLALGFFVFFASYLLYASCLGGIDGPKSDPTFTDFDLIAGCRTDRNRGQNLMRAAG